MILNIARRANQDLDEIWFYWHQKAGIEIAERTIQKITRMMTMICNYPLIGHSRDDLYPSLKTVVAEKYLLFYLVGHSHIDVVRVLHGSRDLRAIFQPDDS